MLPSLKMYITQTVPKIQPDIYQKFSKQITFSHVIFYFRFRIDTIVFLPAKIKKGKPA